MDQLGEARTVLGCGRQCSQVGVCIQFSGMFSILRLGTSCGCTTSECCDVFLLVFAYTEPALPSQSINHPGINSQSVLDRAEIPVAAALKGSFGCSCIYLNSGVLE